MQANHIHFLELLNGDVQYVIPRWQRRYCWGQSDIERLVDDLLTVADVKSGATHYGGTLLTFQEPGSPGVAPAHRVVDGQQRLTTVSILLACIAARLGPEGRCGEWTAPLIHSRLTNQHVSPEKHRKLRLQNGDEEEYRRGLDGNPAGAGAVTQAWRIARRLVARHESARLLRGLERLRVVSIGLGENDDPQQIFESLNATGRPLTESEKVRNWLLMGLPDAVQQDLHDTCWRRIERSLAAEHTSEPIDTFLRDLLRWRTGAVHGINRVYEELRRWAMRHGRAGDRSALCRELAHLAELYGFVTGTMETYPDAKVEHALRHLRAMEIHTHRPLTLRLLHDAAESDRTGATNDTLAKTLDGIGAWVTRMWLANRSMAGMNRAMAELAHGPGPIDGEDVAEHWLGQIRKLRHTRVGVPDDDEVREGLRTRKAYGGSATRVTFAILCAMMEAEQPDEAPSLDRLTVEHVMPRKLTDEWKRYLGGDAAGFHGRYRDRLANLTLSGDSTNSGMGADSFDAKKEVYENKSHIEMTKRLAKESIWNEAALERRAEDLVGRALRLWPWTTPERHEDRPTHETAPFRWRSDEGDWRTESVASRMVLNVASALLDRDPDNAQRLTGEAVSTNMHPASRYPAGTRVGALMMRAVPGHEDYVLYPYESNYPLSAERCRTMGKRCNVRIDVEIGWEESLAQKFWRCLKKRDGRSTWSEGYLEREVSVDETPEPVGRCDRNPVGKGRTALALHLGRRKHEP